MAEYSNQPAIRFSKDLLEHRNDPHVAEIMDVQSKLFATRRAALQRESAALKESAAALTAQLGGMRDLANEGYLPRNRMLDAERTNARTPAPHPAAGARLPQTGGDHAQRLAEGGLQPL
jgi:protease secretion system membrane fusion protein